MPRVNGLRYSNYEITGVKNDVMVIAPNDLEEKNLIRKKYWLALMAFAFSSLMAQVPGAPIKVNGVAIGRVKIQAQVDHLINQRGLNSGGITQPAAYEQIRREVLDQLIVQELLWQETQRRNFIASDADVDEQLEKMKSGFDTEQAFLFKIKEGGFTEASYREDIRQQRSVQRMISEGILASIEVSDEEIKEFYDANSDQMKMPEAIHARHILVKPGSGDDAAKQAAREKIAEVQKKLQDGADFAALATEYSDGPSAPRGGDLGFFGHGQMVSAFEEVAFALQPGEISEVVETQFGFHIIKLDERRDERTVTVTESSERIYEFLTQGKVQETVEKLVNNLRAAATIENAPAP